MKRSGAVVALLAAAAISVGCRGRPRSWDAPVEGAEGDVRAPIVAELDLTSGAPEKSAGGLLSMPSKYTFDALVASLHKMAGRKEIKGVLVSFGSASLGWARAREVGTALSKLRERGVSVLCHADAWDNTTYAAAVRGCDTIAMSPGGEVELTGPAAVIPYMHELLVTQLHAQVDMLQIGKFKGAEEPLTRDGPSDEFRASLENALSAITSSYREGLAIRGVAALAGTGPYMGQETIDQKLVDLLVDLKGARDEAKKRAGGVPVAVVFGPHEKTQSTGLFDLLRSLSQQGSESSSRPHVSLVRLNGEISLGDGGGLFGSAGIDASKVVEHAHALLADDDVKAVVLRIDSPGGSALGSDNAWIALKELRDKKPVIVSIGEMAASGGYYLASTGTRIFAEPESIVGSIGVVGGKISFEGSLAMIGVHTASFGDPRAAQVASMTQPWDDATKARLQAGMETIYGLFLDRIEAGRGRPKATFSNAVEGRVFGGAQAKELGLVDELGGLAEALAAAKKAGGLAEDAPVVADSSGGFFEQLFSSGDDEARLPMGLRLGQGAPIELVAMRDWLLSFVRATEGGRVAAMLPSPLVVR